jgi:hypothetical protein
VRVGVSLCRVSGRIPQTGDEDRPRASDAGGQRVVDDEVNGSTKANSPRGEHAKPEVSTETARLPKPGTAHHAASAPGTSLACGSREWNPQQWTPLRNAPPRVGTKDAHLDPNRYGMRTVDAAGGSATKMAVRFAVRARHSLPSRLTLKVVVASAADAGQPPRTLCSSDARATTPG